jgi:hypothetical protein
MIGDGRNQIYPTEAERLNSLLNAGGHEAGFGHVDPLPLESMLLDGNGDDPTAAPGCEGESTPESNRVTSAPSHINAGTGDITISGTRAVNAGAGEVTVTLTDGVGGTTGPIETTESGTGWTATITAAQRAGLADGLLTVAGAYQHGGTALTGKDAEIVKDTAAPVISVARNGNALTISSNEPGADLRYRNDGGDAGGGDTQVNGPVNLPAGKTTTISVRAADAAGNVSTFKQSYTVANPPAPTPPAPPAQQQQQQVQQAPAPIVAQSARLLARSIRMARRMSASSARRRGIATSFVAPAGTTAADLRLYKTVANGASASARRLVLRRTVKAKPGTNRVRLRSRRLSAGLYTLEVRVGSSRSTLGSASILRIRLTRR